MGRTALICLPYAGSGASFFRSWKSAVPRDIDIDIVAPQLPAREERFAEAPLTSVEQAVEDLLPRVLPSSIAAERVSLFGHSLGAVLAFEIAHRLADLGGISLSRLFVSGSPGPWTVREIRASLLDDEQFLAQVHELAGYSHPALEHAELRELLLPALRADVEMHENYRPPAHTPLAIPITSLRGRDDELVTPEHTAEWAAATTALCSTFELNGGHMYVTDQATALLRLIAAQLAAPEPR